MYKENALKSPVKPNRKLIVSPNKQVTTNKFISDSLSHKWQPKVGLKGHEIVSEIISMRGKSDSTKVNELLRHFVT